MRENPLRTGAPDCSPATPASSDRDPDVRTSRIAVPPGDPLPPRPLAPAADPEARNPTPTNKRILIADDDALVRGSLAAVLESEGFVVDEAGNGREAVVRAAAQHPDLVLLDLNMPHWDGWTAFSQLDRVAPFMPVIVITARPNQFPRAVQLGVDAFMEKPLNIPVLMRAIRHLISDDGGRFRRRTARSERSTQFLHEPET